ncbi:N-alpha-acetyltransferase 40-like isoform X2 [Corticium candelabrum]|uniref:N-alpha-acetyltransferase 40-like isoform X2 n=1 Tax=Corticium candelabrum TaxID=121492 RepID=UPI002E26B641|nr:N-alpha-acetyltransferase 40-like isoform X2 [Corticium candelabrum]
MKKAKSSKGKEKKLQHKQRLAEIAKSQAIIDDANKAPNPMQHFTAFQKFDRNGLSLSIECKRVSELSRDDLDWAFRLTKSNMQDLYELGGWKWHDGKTKGEMEDENCWFLIARKAGCPVAFVNFRYELGDEDVEICYWAKMRKIVCTVLKANDRSMNFFQNKMKYSADSTCPSQCDLLNADDYCYEILSKLLIV